MTGIMHCVAKDVVVRSQNRVDAAYIPQPMLALFLNGVLQAPGTDYRVDLETEDVVFARKLRHDDSIAFMYDAKAILCAKRK